MSVIQVVATIGPACKDESTIAAMIAAGMSLARLNFSWGTHEEHAQFLERVRAAAQAAGVHVPIIQDLSGPRMITEHGHTFAAEETVLTEKDKRDLRGLLSLQPEYVAQSFVASAADIEALRAELDSLGHTGRIIAKIERQEALDNLTDIIAAADGIMIARGDLGEAIPLETLPFVKQHILAECTKAGVPTIVATEMLTSMIDDPIPSRADVSDIADAVVDGASATMLSNETAVGKNPVEAVALMRRVVDEASRHIADAPVQF